MALIFETIGTDCNHYHQALMSNSGDNGFILLDDAALEKAKPINMAQWQVRFFFLNFQLQDRRIVGQPVAAQPPLVRTI